MNPIKISDTDISIQIDEQLTDEQPICPLCGEKKDALVNCGAHEHSFDDAQRMKSAANNLYDIIGSAAAYAYNSEERDCFVCTECRSAYLQYSSFCPLYVLYQGIYAFIDEQKFLYNRSEEEAMKLLWKNQSDMDVKPNTVIHRYRITSAVDATQTLSIN